jgi:hypothetical protein
MAVKRKNPFDFFLPQQHKSDTVSKPNTLISKLLKKINRSKRNLLKSQKAAGRFFNTTHMKHPLDLCYLIAYYL